MESTEAIKDQAETHAEELLELLPESAHARWTFGIEKKGRTRYAELMIAGQRGDPIVVKEAHENLYQAIHDVARKAKHLMVDKQKGKRSSKRHEKVETSDDGNDAAGF